MENTLTRKLKHNTPLTNLPLVPYIMPERTSQVTFICCLFTLLLNEGQTFIACRDKVRI